jgi:hypothetical protein
MDRMGPLTSGLSPSDTLILLAIMVLLEKLMAGDFKMVGDFKDGR